MSPLNENGGRERTRTQINSLRYQLRYREAGDDEAYGLDEKGGEGERKLTVCATGCATGEREASLEYRLQAGFLRLRQDR